MKISKSAGFAFIYRNKILLSHPTGAPWHGSYSIIKGGAERGDRDTIVTAAREFIEETGFELKYASVEHILAKKWQTPDIVLKTKKGDKELSAWIIPIDDLSIIGLKEDAKGSIHYPKEQLQLEEIDWAGFVDITEAYTRIGPYQQPILEFAEKIIKQPIMKNKESNLEKDIDRIKQLAAEAYKDGKQSAITFNEEAMKIYEEKPVNERRKISDAYYDAYMEAKENAENDKKEEEPIWFTPEAEKFVPKSQLAFLRELDEEGLKEYEDVFKHINKVVAEMPKSYDTENTMHEELKAWLHYFAGNQDWYITEKDMGSPDDLPEDKGVQRQAFGYANLGYEDGLGELGYISIEEMRDIPGVELDFHFEPTLITELEEEKGTPAELPKVEPVVVEAKKEVPPILPLPKEAEPQQATGSANLGKMAADQEKTIKYIPFSDICDGTLDTVVPKEQASESSGAMLSLVKFIKDSYNMTLNEFVQDRLKYTAEELGLNPREIKKLTPEEQRARLARAVCESGILKPEQIDGVALAIFNIETRKQGIIVGDMTGIGKGRQAAALLRYAIVYQKKIPIFVTEKSYLFSDIFRDLIDIKSDANIPQRFKMKEELKKPVKMNAEERKRTILELVEAGDSQEEAEEKVQAMEYAGYVMVAQYKTNVEYQNQVAEAKRSKLLSVVPFIINNRDKYSEVKNMNGDILYTAQVNAGSEFKESMEKLTIPHGYNAILTTYTQFNAAMMTPKKRWFEHMCKDNIVILDEAHNASGDSNTGKFMISCLKETMGAMFLSATYAKRPSNMVVYSNKTSIRDSGLKDERLIEAIRKGGVPLQQIISGQLVAEGQMIRRERSYDGINILYNRLDSSMALDGHPEFDLKDKHRAVANTFFEILRDIIKLQHDQIRPWLQDKGNATALVAGIYGEVEIAKGYDVGKACTSSPVFSRVFNIVNQLLFSITAEPVAERAIDYLQQGKKPVIVFANTMEAFLDGMTNDEGLPLREGDEISSDFKLVLDKLLRNILQIQIKSANGEVKRKELDISQLPSNALDNYKSIAAKIKNVSIGISISPIDMLIRRIKAAGFTVEEVTGRQSRLELLNDEGTRGAYMSRTKPDTTTAFRKFNQNETDCLLVNRSGATGASIHATTNTVVNKVKVELEAAGGHKEYKTVPFVKGMTEKIVIPASLEPRDEVKQRVMLILQPELDINLEVQKRGRIFRSGQVLPPMYEYLCSAIPAVERMQMMLQRKLRSLDANTSSNQKQSDKVINIVDFLNKYGDQLVVKYLMENQQIISVIGDPLGMRDKETGVISAPKDDIDAAYKVSGRIAILNTTAQENFYREMTERYIDMVTFLKSVDEYDLEVEYLDLQATSVNKSMLIAGVGGKSLFGRNSILEKCEVNNLRKPYKREDLEMMINENLGEYANYHNNAAKAQQTDYLDRQKKQYEERISNLRSEYDEEREERIGRLKQDRAYVNLVEKKPELAARWIKEKEVDIKKEIEENYESDVTRFRSSYEKVRNVLQRIYTGMSTYYVKGESKVRAIVVGYDIDFSKKNPWNQGNIKVRVAVANGIRMVSVPLTNLEFLDSIIANKSFEREEDARAMKDWNAIAKQSSADRVTRYIVTGNILQAMGNDVVAGNGRLVKYTTDNKKIKAGVLMSQEFNPVTAEGRGSAMVLVPASKCSVLLDGLDYRGTNSPRYITTENIEFTRAQNDRDFLVRVPKDKNTKSFVTNPKVLEFINESKGFETWGSMDIWKPGETEPERGQTAMGATIDEERMPSFLDFLSNTYGSKFKVAKPVFEEKKGLMGIDDQVGYDDEDKAIDESESGLAQEVIQIEDPLRQQIAESQQDPVAEVGKQVVIEEKQVSVHKEPQEQIVSVTDADHAKLEMLLLKLQNVLFKNGFTLPKAEVIKNVHPVDGLKNLLDDAIIDLQEGDGDFPHIDDFRYALHDAGEDIPRINKAVNEFEKESLNQLGDTQLAKNIEHAIEKYRHESGQSTESKQINAEEALKLLRSGKMIRVRGYQDDMENFTGVDIGSDFDNGETDEEIKEWLEDYPELQFWGEAAENIKKGG